jgi:hypothetical protein
MKRAIILLTALLLVLSALPVAAGGRVFGGKFDFFLDPATIDDLCAFDVIWVGHLDGSFRYVAMPDGTYLEVDNWAEQDTFTGPTGKTLTSDWYHYRISGRLDEDGDIISQTASGQIMVIRLPDGSIFRSAGLVRFDPLVQVFAITPDHGLTGDVDAFCAALEP